MYQSIPSLTTPGQNPWANFWMSEFPIPGQKKEFRKSSKPPPSGPIKRAKTPPLGAFSSIIHNKTLQNETEIM